MAVSECHIPDVLATKVVRIFAWHRITLKAHRTEGGVTLRGVVCVGAWTLVARCALATM